MSQSTAKKSVDSICYLERRAQNLDTTSYLLAVTKKGVGQILDVNDRGLTFGCLYRHFFQTN